MIAQDLTDLHASIIGGAYWTDAVYGPGMNNAAAEALQELVDHGLMQRASDRRTS